jgi:hypothetical protein
VNEHTDGTDTATQLNILLAQMTPLVEKGVLYVMGLQSELYIHDSHNHFTCYIFCGVAWLEAVNVRTGAPWWRTRTADIYLGGLGL